MFAVNIATATIGHVLKGKQTCQIDDMTFALTHTLQHRLTCL